MAGEWLSKQGFEVIHPEYPFGESRIDFYMERSGERYVMEVKGCTLAENGVGLFPDAPTQRGSKHLRELSKAAGQGYHAIIAFVIMLNGVETVEPNEAIDQAVETKFIKCRCSADKVELI